MFYLAHRKCQISQKMRYKSVLTKKQITPAKQLERRVKSKNNQKYHQRPNNALLTEFILWNSMDNEERVSPLKKTEAEN